MRLNINLNKHLEDLDLECVNQIFRYMMDLQPTVDKLDFIYNEWSRKLNMESEDKVRSWKIAEKMNRVNLIFKLRELDKYLTSIGRPPVFSVRKEALTTYALTEEDITSVIQEYRFLMAEPEA